jgi:hypothetical protein
LPHYHLSFVNDADMLTVAVNNDRDRSIFTRLIGRGTKFDLDIPLDQSLSIVVTAAPSTRPLGAESSVATVDIDPFLVRGR